MSPPPYSDFGKRAKDVFNKGCHYGLIKLDCKTKNCGGVEVNTVGTSNQESGKVSGSLQTKYKVKDCGLSFTEKWNTDNTLGSNNTKFGIGAKYDLDQDAALRAKINNSSQIGLGYQQRLREGATFTLSALINGKNFNNGGHQIWLAIELVA
nr:voltage-dependent anion-selective channel-like [Leptinotarsa decemlineata]